MDGTKPTEIQSKAMQALFDLSEALGAGLSLGDLADVIRLAVPKESYQALDMNLLFVRHALKRLDDEASSPGAGQTAR